MPFMGNLPVVERARLAHWFETHIADGDKKLRLQWFGRLPIAHTCTLYITALLRKGAGTRTKATSSDEIEMLQAAWNIQTDDPPLEQIFANVDVDKECLEHLEEEMFERSALAGVAGNYQWGLVIIRKAGTHMMAHLLSGITKIETAARVNTRYVEMFAI